MIRSERPSLAASLVDAVPSVPAAGRLGLLVPNGTAFHMDQLRDRANMILMETAASAIFGAGVRVSLEFGRSVTHESVVERTIGRAAEARASSDGSKGRDTDDPMVLKVVEMFDGRITSQRKEE